MFLYLQKSKNCLFKRYLCLSIALSFLVGLLSPGILQAQEVPFLATLPQPGAMIGVTPEFTPSIIRGLQIHPENPLEFSFLIDTGENKLQGTALKRESVKLIKYFLASMTIPEDKMWVNLSPYEKDRVIADGFGDTEMGRDLLGQDYLLKQLTASLIYPEDALGKKFWNAIYQKVYEKYGTTDIPMDTFNKVWIVPDQATVYEKGNGAYVVQRHLKVMLEEDYLARSQVSDLRSQYLKDGLQEKPLKPEAWNLSTEIIRQIVIPAIEKEVNTGKNFANLRQIYNSMILAFWYKKNLKETLLAKVYADKSKTVGIESRDKEINQKIYDQYLQAFRKGVYNYIKEDYDAKTQEIVSRKYFSGGMVGVKSIRVQKGGPLSPKMLAEGFGTQDSAMVIVDSKFLDVGKDKKIDLAEFEQDMIGDSKTDQAMLVGFVNNTFGINGKNKKSTKEQRGPVILGDILYNEILRKYYGKVLHEDQIAKAINKHLGVVDKKDYFLITKAELRNLLSELRKTKKVIQGGKDTWYIVDQKELSYEFYKLLYKLHGLRTERKGYLKKPWQIDINKLENDLSKMNVFPNAISYPKKDKGETSVSILGYLLDLLKSQGFAESAEGEGQFILKANEAYIVRILREDMSRYIRKYFGSGTFTFEGLQAHFEKNKIGYHLLHMVNGRYLKQILDGLVAEDKVVHYENGSDEGYRYVDDEKRQFVHLKAFLVYFHNDLRRINIQKQKAQIKKDNRKKIRRFLLWFLDRHFWQRDFTFSMVKAAIDDYKEHKYAGAWVRQLSDEDLFQVLESLLKIKNNVNNQPFIKESGMSFDDGEIQETYQLNREAFFPQGVRIKTKAEKDLEEKRAAEKLKVKKELAEKKTKKMAMLLLGFIKKNIGSEPFDKKSLREALVAYKARLVDFKVRDGLQPWIDALIDAFFSENEKVLTDIFSKLLSLEDPLTKRPYISQTDPDAKVWDNVQYQLNNMTDAAREQGEVSEGEELEKKVDDLETQNNGPKTVSKEVYLLLGFVRQYVQIPFDQDSLWEELKRPRRNGNGTVSITGEKKELFYELVAPWIRSITEEKFRKEFFPALIRLKDPYRDRNYFIPGNYWIDGVKTYGYRLYGAKDRTAVVQKNSEEEELQAGIDKLKTEDLDTLVSYETRRKFLLRFEDWFFFNRDFTFEEFKEKFNEHKQYKYAEGWIKDVKDQNIRDLFNELKYIKDQSSARVLNGRLSRDAAQTAAEYGGINFDPSLLDLKIKRDENFVPLPMDQQPPEIYQQIQGFIPVIIHISPVSNLPLQLGLLNSFDKSPRARRL